MDPAAQQSLVLRASVAPPEATQRFDDAIESATHMINLGTPNTREAYYWRAWIHHYRRELDLDSVAKWILDHAAYSTRVPLMASLEKALARQLVEKLGEKTMAARLLGISKPTLYSRLK